MRWKPSELIRVGAAAALLVALGGDAGVRRFDMTTDASSNSEGEIELEGWLDFGKPASSSHHQGGKTNGMAWLGVRIGLLDNVELASFLVLEKKDMVYIVPAPDVNSANADGTFPQPRTVNPDGGVGDLILQEDQSGLMMWVSEIRWRPVEVGKWPIDLFIQFQLIHWFEKYHPTQFHFTLGASKQLGRFLAAGNISYWDSVLIASLTPNETIRWQWLDFAVGVTANLVEAEGWVPSINLGVEAWGFIPIPGASHVHNHNLHGGGLIVGPTLSLARGRLWLTGHFGFPVAVPIFVAGQEQPIGLGFKPPYLGRIMMGINL